MIDIRRGIARIGYVVLALWASCWMALVTWGITYGHPDGSQWPLTLTTLIGFPLAVFLLWRLLLWILSGFIRST